MDGRSNSLSIFFQRAPIFGQFVLSHSEWISSSDRNRSRGEQWVGRNSLGFGHKIRLNTAGRCAVEIERVWE